MNPTTDHLSRIQTWWTVQLRAAQDKGEAAEERQHLLLRYYGAAYRYILGMVQDEDLAEELTQDFALRFLRGDFRQADPQRGRFRDLLKTALRRQVIDCWRRRGRDKKEGPRPLGEGTEPAAPPADEAAHDAAFLHQWRQELLHRAWEALARGQAESGVPYHTVLRCRVDRPEARMADLARQVSDRLGKRITENTYRVALHRARRRFAELLLEEVSRSLETSVQERLEDELIELGLLKYCRPALASPPRDS
jgi:RNA polymerase sigma-70 factor (ECF subfamily)